MYDEIIARHKPRGWKVSHTRTKTKIIEETETFWSDGRRKHDKGGERDCAVSYPIAKCIYAPKIVGPATLFVLLHEFAHVHLRHWEQGKSSLHREEYEAERWACHIMHAEGIPVPRWIIKLSKWYIRRCIESDSMKGLKIHPPARRFVR